MSFSIPARYTRTAIILHWVIAVLIICNFLIVWSVDALPKGAERPLIDLHKSFGLTVLGLAIMRLLWRLIHPAPPLPAGYGKLERLGAHAAHWSLYALIFAMPISGWLHDSAWKGAAGHPLRLYGFIPWFRLGVVADLPPARKEAMHTLFSQVHAFLGWVLVALFVAHVAGALKHQFWDREKELQRMLPG
jgi:cytochrome b561